MAYSDETGRKHRCKKNPSRCPTHLSLQACSTTDHQRPLALPGSLVQTFADHIDQAAGKKRCCK